MAFRTLELQAKLSTASVERNKAIAALDELDRGQSKG
jgi:hypothetical protein